MLYLILGQPRTGKSTLADIINKKYNYPIIHTDEVRREYGYHLPHNGFATEIDNNKQREFYAKLMVLANSYSNVIVEGSAIYPQDHKIFRANRTVLLSRMGITNKEMLNDCRRFDNKDSWTRKRTDEYLLDLFDNYIKFAKDWEIKNKDILIDTYKFDLGINNALRFLKL